jgi:hypothetical protein
MTPAVPPDGVPRGPELEARDASPEAPASTSLGFLRRPAGTRSFLTVIAIGAVATIAALVVGSRPLFEAARARARADAAAAVQRAREPRRRAGIVVRIAPPLPLEGPQRLAAEVIPGPDARAELVATGERLRIGIQPGGHAYYFVVSVDERGRVAPLYPEFGTSLDLPPASSLQDLPDAIELTGRGQERLIVLLSDVPLELDEIQRAVTGALARAGGVLSRMPRLAIAGEQFHRLLQKP